MRWRIVGLSILVVTVGTLPGFLPGALAVQLGEDLGLAEAGIGLIVGSSFALSALISPRLGHLAERLGWARAVRFAGGGAAAALMLIATVGGSVWGFGLLTVASGFVLALAHPAVNLAIARCTPPRRQGLVYGMKHAAIPAATAIAGLGLPLLAIPLGWRWVYVFGALLALIAVVLVPARPARYEVDPPAFSSGGRGSPKSVSPLSLLVIMAIGAGLGIFAMNSLATFLVPFAVESGFAEGSAGILLALGSSLGILMRVFAGWSIDRRASASLVTVAAFLAAGALGMALLTTGARVAIIVGSVIAFAFGWGWSGLYTFSVVTRNLHAPAVSTAIAMTGIYVGAALGPALIGFIAESSFVFAWVVTASALAVGSLLMSIAVWRDRA